AALAGSVIGIQERAVIAPSLGCQQAPRDALQDIVMTVQILLPRRSSRQGANQQAHRSITKRANAA
ncbi:MAG: hypothetical protein WAK55_08065, partial [Xanthobacteraceae bacterium]